MAEPVEQIDPETPETAAANSPETDRTVRDEAQPESPPADDFIEAIKAESDSLRAEAQALRAELTETKDNLLRKSADFENYRKRILKEREEEKKFSYSSLLLDLITVLDDFERAIKSSETARDYDSFHSGIAMIENQFVSLLERKYHLQRFNALGETFDPGRHEAISMEAQEQDRDIVVVEEYQKGYALHDRVLRTAKVKVGHAKTEQEPQKTEA